MVIADRYSLEREIGRGGMGAVWLGRDELLGRPVALKRVGIAPGGVNPEIARAEREAKLAASLSHPNVVSVFDLAPDGDLQWLVMEYVEGTDLAALVRRDGALDPDAAAPILAQVAAALVAAHAAGVVHRDIKPSNILVTPDGQAKLSDFGIARTIGDASLTQTGLVTGSPAYLSPEVASGRSATDRSDVWSLGATAFHAVSGHPPYEIGDNLIGALYRIVHEPPPRPAEPGWLAPFFEATMVQDEDARWSAEQVRDFLAAGPPAPVAPTTRSRSRSRRAARVTAAPGADLTQLLTPVEAVGQARQGRAEPVDREAGPRMPVLLTIAALAVVALLSLATWLLLGDRDAPSQQAAPPEATPSAQPSESPSPTAEPDPPTAAAMTAFAQNYLATASTDQDAGFAMLTSNYQASSGQQDYSDFWGRVSDIDVRSIQADPEALTVTYDYRYRLGDSRPPAETVTLQLAYEDGRYLIAGASSAPS